jgi:hypothetical protein
MTERPLATSRHPGKSNGACLIIRDANGHALSYVYHEAKAGRRTAANLLTRDEARRIAINIAKHSLPRSTCGPP